MLDSIYMYLCMYVCMYVLMYDYMAPIRPQLLVSHAIHSSTETSLCMYVCMYVWCFVGFYVLFNDAPNTFYLRLYGVNHMVKDHSDSERKPAAATWATLSE